MALAICLIPTSKAAATVADIDATVTRTEPINEKTEQYCTDD